MDNFIKMCSAPEIQDGWEPKVGDWTDKGVVTKIYHRLGTGIVSTLGLYDEKVHYRRQYFSADIAVVIYLPTIEQLMGMVFTKWTDGDIVANQHRFYLWCAKYWIWGNSSDGEVYKTPQELWLAFVMWGLHSKLWENGEWTKKS